MEKRAAIPAEILGDLGEGAFFQGPITFHYGKHTHIGKRFFGNFNLTVQDDADVYIGDDCNFGPNVTIVTPCTRWWRRSEPVSGRQTEPSGGCAGRARCASGISAGSVPV